MTRPQSLDYAALTATSKGIWSSGDFHVIGRQVMPVAEALCQAAEVRAGQRVLDVACGSGNSTLIAARRYAEAIGIDYVPELVARAQRRAETEGTPAEFRVADAQALPFPDQTFDAVISIFGVMFAPNQALAASELLRVCRPGGKIAIASWMPTEYGGDLLGVHARFSEAVAGLELPTRWGSEEGVVELLEPGANVNSVSRPTFFQYYRSIDHVLDTFRKHFGPTHYLLKSLDAEAAQRFLNELAAVFQKYNRVTDGSVKLECRYLEVIANKRP